MQRLVLRFLCGFLFTCAICLCTSVDGTLVASKSGGKTGCERCKENEECYDSSYGFGKLCRCKEGYQRDENGVCIDGCERCKENEECYDSGDYYYPKLCRCKEGYTWDRNFKCINECEKCKENEKCVPSDRYPYNKICLCKDGYEFDENYVCQECKCGENANCRKNLFRKLECFCNPGYVKNKADGTCQVCPPGYGYIPSIFRHAYCRKCDCGKQFDCEFSSFAFTDKKCICPKGYHFLRDYERPRCIANCRENPCQNGGTCIVKSEEDLVCDCPPGYTGEFCETGSS